MQTNEISFKFVDRIPNVLQKQVLYICIPCNVAVHACACGCGEKVVTPIDPSQWTLTYTGEAVSLYPSIGNFSYKCNSHYYIQDNRIKWVRQWPDSEIIEYEEGKKEAVKKKKSLWRRIFDD